MDFTLGEAARQCGVAKGTISKAIKTGKLSATRREDGSWKIDNAELARYLEANGHRFRSDTVETGRPETGGETTAQLTPWWPTYAPSLPTCGKTATIGVNRRNGWRCPLRNRKRNP